MSKKVKSQEECEILGFEFLGLEVPNLVDLTNCVDKETMHHHLTTSMDNTSKWNQKRREDDQKPKKCQLTKERESSSKWGDYLIQDEDNSLRFSAEKFDEHSAYLSSNMLQTFTNEERVDDDEIHPDFL